MILPTKHLPVDKSVIGASAILLPLVEKDYLTVSQLWNKVLVEEILSFDLFLLGLDFLFILGVIDHRNGRLART
jgi:hypothetical protein